MTELQGRVALVTGASRGLGKAIAAGFAAAGAAVILIDLKESWATAAAGEITAAGGQALGLGADVSDREALQGAIRQGAAHFGGLDVLVNNAMWNSYNPIAEITPEIMARMIGTGMAGVVWGMQAAAPLMAARGGGSIITIGSMAARLGSSGGLLYSGVKAAVEGMTRAASVELGPQHIRVNAIAPSTIATEGVLAMLDAAAFERRVAATPLGRLGEVTDIARTALWLAGDGSGFVTGQSIAVDGGLGHALYR